MNFITKSEIKVLKELDFKKVIENQISLKNNKTNDSEGISSFETFKNEFLKTQQGKWLFL